MSRKQKSHIRRWHPDIDSEWLTRSQAADYLGWHVRTLDRSLVIMKDQPVAGKIRFIRMNTTNRIKPIRVWAQDVYALCPGPIK